MKNRLATHLTTWKIWYLVIPLLALMIGSQLGLLGQFVPALQGIDVVLQFVVMAVLALVLLRLVSRRWPTAQDLALKPGMRLWEIGLVLAVFVVTHLIFWLLARGAGEQSGQAVELFQSFGLDRGLQYALPIILATVILAPVCEEILYRGILLRSVHDGLMRRIPRGVATTIAVLVSSVAFAFPHLGDSLFGRMAVAYLVTGIAFGFVYVVTGSLTSAMVSHSLQSCYSYLQILYYGRGEADVPVLLWVLGAACPILVFLVARGLYAILPKTPAQAPSQQPADHTT